MADTGTYVDYLPEAMRPPTAPSWEDVAESYKQKYPALDQEYLRVRYEQALQYRQARIRARDNPETTQQRLGRSIVPYASSIANAAENVQAARAQKRIEDGNPGPGDYDTAAAYEQLQKQQEERTRTLGGKLTEAALTAPAMIGEFLSGGAALKAAGMAGALGGQALKVAIPTFGVRLAAQTALAPSTYAKTFIDNNREAGRDPLALAGFPAAFGLGMVQNAILGSLGNNLGALGRIPGLGVVKALEGPGTANFVGRMAAKGGLGAVESQAADLVTGSVQDVVRAYLPSLTRKETHYGSVQDLLDGKGGEALKTVTAQALTFAMFGMMHEAMHGTPERQRGVQQSAVMETFARRLESEGKKGLSGTAAGGGLADVAERLAQHLESNPSPTRAEVATLLKDFKGTAGEYAQAVAGTFPTKRSGPKSQPPAAEAPAPQAPAPPAAPPQNRPAQAAPVAAEPPAPPSPAATLAAPAEPVKPGLDYAELARGLGFKDKDLVEFGNGLRRKRGLKDLSGKQMPMQEAARALLLEKLGGEEGLAKLAGMLQNAEVKSSKPQMVKQKAADYGASAEPPPEAKEQPPPEPPAPAPEAKPVPETVQPIRSAGEGPATAKQEVVTPEPTAGRTGQRAGSPPTAEKAPAAGWQHAGTRFRYVDEGDKPRAVFVGRDGAVYEVEGRWDGEGKQATLGVTLKDARGKSLGGVNLDRHEDASGKDFAAHQLLVSEDYHGRGLGNAIYDFATEQLQKRGGRLLPSKEQSPDARQLWAGSHERAAGRPAKAAAEPPSAEQVEALRGEAESAAAVKQSARVARTREKLERLRDEAATLDDDKIREQFANATTSRSLTESQELARHFGLPVTPGIGSKALLQPLLEAMLASKRSAGQEQIRQRVLKVVDASSEGSMTEILDLLNEGKEPEQEMRKAELRGHLDALLDAGLIHQEAGPTGGKIYVRTIKEEPVPGSVQLQQVFDRAGLTPLQQSELHDYHGGLTQDEIGRKRGVGRAAVSASMRKALARLEALGGDLPDTMHDLLVRLKEQNRPKAQDVPKEELTHNRKTAEAQSGVLASHLNKLEEQRDALTEKVAKQGGKWTDADRRRYEQLAEDFGGENPPAERGPAQGTEGPGAGPAEAPDHAETAAESYPVGGKEKAWRDYAGRNGLDPEELVGRVRREQAHDREQAEGYNKILQQMRESMAKREKRRRQWTREKYEDASKATGLDEVATEYRNSHPELWEKDETPGDGLYRMLHEGNRKTDAPEQVYRRVADDMRSGKGVDRITRHSQEAQEHDPFDISKEEAETIIALNEAMDRLPGEVARQEVEASRKALEKHGFPEDVVRAAERAVHYLGEGEKWSHSLESLVGGFEGAEETKRQGGGGIGEDQMIRDHLKKVIALRKKMGTDAWWELQEKEKKAREQAPVADDSFDFGANESAAPGTGDRPEVKSPLPRHIQKEFDNAKTVGAKIHAAAEADTRVLDPIYGSDQYKQGGFKSNEVLRVLDQRYQSLKKAGVSAQKANESLDSTREHVVGQIAAMRKAGMAEAADWYEQTGLPLVEEARRDLLGKTGEGFGQPLSVEERKPLLGGAQPDAQEQAQQATQKTRALANDLIDADRRKAGREALLAATRKSDAVVMNQADAALAKNPRAAYELVAALEKNPRPVRDWEDGLLLHHKVALENELDRATVEAVKAAQAERVASANGTLPPDPERLAATAEAFRKVDQSIEGLDQLERVVRKVGTEQGRGLRFRAVLLADDFSLAGMVRKLTAAKKGELTPEEITQVKELQKRIAELQARVKELENATPQPGREKQAKEAAAEARVDVVEAKRQFKGMEETAKFGSESVPRKVFQSAFGLFDVARALKTMWDLSATLHQGGLLSFGNPLKMADAFPDMIRAFGSTRAADRAMDAINQRANAELYRRAGLYLAEPDGPLSGSEEAFMGRWVKKIPGLAGSERAYNTFLNRLRADVFDAMAASGKEGKVSAPEATVLADFVNKATGRGGLGSWEKAAVPLARLFFSPRFVASRFQLLAGQPFYEGTGQTRMLIAKEYAKTLLGLGVFYTVAKLADPDKVKLEGDARSADFGKIVIGNTHIDPMAGLAQVAVLASRATTGQTKSTTTGKVSDLVGDNRKFGGQSLSDVLVRFVRSKLAPGPGALWNLREGQNVVGEKHTIPEELWETVSPMAVEDVYKAMRDQGAPENMAISLLALLGMGTQVYEPRRPRKKNAG